MGDKPDLPSIISAALDHMQHYGSHTVEARIIIPTPKIVDDLRAENKILREVAEHYADDENWSEPSYDYSRVGTKDTYINNDLDSEGIHGFEFAQRKLEELKCLTQDT